MAKYSVLFLILSMIFTVVTYLSTSSIICAVIVFMASILYFYIIARSIISKYLNKSSLYHSCYTFINSFIISLSIKGSLLSAFKAVKLNMDKQYISVYKGITGLSDVEKLNYLKSYFKFDVFNLFLSIVSIYQEQGGDIFDLSRYLISDLRRSEDFLIKCESSSKRKVVDFSILWAFTLVILVILRFALSQFYTLITGLLFYKIAIVAMFILIIISIHFLILRVTNVNIKGFKDA